MKRQSEKGKKNIRKKWKGWKAWTLAFVRRTCTVVLVAMFPFSHILYSIVWKKISLVLMNSFCVFLFFKIFVCVLFVCVRVFFASIDAHRSDFFRSFLFHFLCLSRFRFGFCCRCLFFRFHPFDSGWLCALCTVCLFTSDASSFFSSVHLFNTF